MWEIDESDEPPSEEGGAGEEGLEAAVEVPYDGHALDIPWSGGMVTTTLPEILGLDKKVRPLCADFRSLLVSVCEREGVVVSSDGYVWDIMDDGRAGGAVATPWSLCGRLEKKCSASDGRSVETTTFERSVKITTFLCDSGVDPRTVTACRLKMVRNDSVHMKHEK